LIFESGDWHYLQMKFNKKFYVYKNGYIRTSSNTYTTDNIN